jgi:hypothetical protein
VIVYKYKVETIGTLLDHPLFWLDNTFKDKIRGFKGECAHFRFNKCPIFSHDGASAKFSIYSQETNHNALGFLDGVVLGKIFIAVFFLLEHAAYLGLSNCRKLVFHVALDAEVKI